MLVAKLNDLHDRPHDRGRGALRVMPPRDDAVEELAPLAELHHEVHGALVLARLPEAHDARAPGEVAHDRDLAAHVIDVHRGAQLPLRDRLAREQLPGVAVHAQVGDPEFAAPELAVEDVLVVDALAAPLGEHREALRMVSTCASAPAAAAAPAVGVATVVVLPPRAAVVVMVVGAGEVGLHVLASRCGRGAATVPHCSLFSPAAADLVVETLDGERGSADEDLGFHIRGREDATR